MAVSYPENGPRRTKYEAVRLETYGNQTSRKTKTTMARGCHGTSKEAKRKIWKETAKDRRTWRDLAEKAKTTNGYSVMMIMMMMMTMIQMYTDVRRVQKYRTRNSNQRKSQSYNSNHIHLYHEYFAFSIS
jgi:hypothetical protein